MDPGDDAADAARHDAEEALGNFGAAAEARE